ncbi:hypothetical protein F4604DRAFT_1195621 [Suillus subluteus]|nr:hypothetical protein F4604DRAFT_1195621 [Suillus subluteus]
MSLPYCESQPVSDHKYPSDHKSTHNMLVFRMSLPHGRYSRVRWYARNFLSTCVPAAAPPEAPLTAREDESQTQSDGPELPHPTEATRADDSSASVDLREGDEKLNRNPGVASGEITGTSVANGDAYACAECGIKMKNIFYNSIPRLPYAVIVHSAMYSTWSQSTTLTNTGWSRLKTGFEMWTSQHQTNLWITWTRLPRFPYESTS